MSFKSAIRTCLTEKYFTIEGRASRAEYWYFSLFFGLLYLVFLGLSEGLGAFVTGLWTEFTALTMLAALAVLALLIPMFTVTTRRLHDINVSFKLYLLCLIALGLLLAMLGASERTMSIIGWLVILAVALIPGSESDNKFGPEPTWHAPSTAPLKPLTPKLRAAPLVLVALALVYDISTRHTADTFSTLQADGSREVTLQDAGKDKQIDTGDDAVWVLRFPAALNATPSGARYWQMNHRAPKTTLNKNAAFELPLTELPDFTPDEANPDSNTLKVILRAARKPYAPEGDPATRKEYDRSAYLTNWPFRVVHDAQTSFYCRKDAEVAPGVFQLRVPNEAEEQAMIASHGRRGKLAANECESYNGRSRSYAVYDAAGAAVALGSCLGGSAQRPPHSCHFRFWLPQERIASYRFHYRHMPHLRDMHTYVTKLVTEATVTAKSRNIGSP